MSRVLREALEGMPPSPHDVGQLRACGRRLIEAQEPKRAQEVRKVPAWQTACCCRLELPLAHDLVNPITGILTVRCCGQDQNSTLTWPCCKFNIGLNSFTLDRIRSAQASFSAAQGLTDSNAEIAGSCTVAQLEEAVLPPAPQRIVPYPYLRGCKCAAHVLTCQGQTALRASPPASGARQTAAPLCSGAATWRAFCLGFKVNNW